MTRFDSGATDDFVPAGAAHAENPVSSYRRFIGPVAAVIVAAGLALPLAYYASFPARESPPPAVVSSSLATPEKVSALVAASDVGAAEPERAAARAARVETASPPPAVEDLQPKVPSRDDPRWARTAGTGGSTLPEPLETAELRSKLEKLQEPAPAAATPVSGDLQEAPVPSAAAEVPEGTSETDATFTGTIPAGEAAAATPDGIAGETAPPAEELATVPDAAAEEPVAEAEEPATRSAKITTHVNMRAGPENEAEVLTVLPIGASVNVMGDCQHWCEVDFQGRRGYVYKSFVSGT